MVFTFPQLDQRLLLNTTIGFDRLFSILEHSAASKPPSYPPYNIVKGETENSYKIELAVAGFNRDELEIFKEESDPHETSSPSLPWLIMSRLSTLVLIVAFLLSCSNFESQKRRNQRRLISLRDLRRINLVQRRNSLANRVCVGGVIPSHFLINSL